MARVAPAGLRELIGGGSAVLGTVLLGGLLCGCTQYERVRMEFDSAVAYGQEGPEAARMVYTGEALRWPWAVRQLEGTGVDALLASVFGVEPERRELANPSGFVRQRIGVLGDLASGDHARSAEVALRLLWLLEQDLGHPVTEMVTLDVVALLIAELGVDPLEVPEPAEELEAVEREARATDVLEALAPAARGGRRLDAREVQRYRAALQVVGARPAVASARARRWIRATLDAATSETDPRLVAATRTAFVRTLGNSLSHALREALTAPEPSVREAALVALVRTAGPEAVPYSFKVLARDYARGNRFDSSPVFRRRWVRLCAQLPAEVLFRSVDGGVRPIEFLYETATHDEDVGLQRIALDALARALDKPIVMDRDWADAWWRSYTGSRSLR